MNSEPLSLMFGILIAACAVIIPVFFARWMADKKGRNTVFWMIAALLLPVIAPILVALLPRKQRF